MKNEKNDKILKIEQNKQKQLQQQQSSSSSSSSQGEQITQNEILQMLHRKKMSLIQSRFQQRQKGLPIDDFLIVMLQHLQYDKKNVKLKMKLTLALIDFFKQVDVNGDQTMQWQQFSNHIIELGLLRNDRSFKNVIKSYHLSQKIIDKQKHQTGVQSIYYFQKLKNLFLFEKQSSRFKVYNINNADLMYQVNAHKGSILDLEYLQDQNLIATSSNDLTINFWDAASFNLKQIVSVPEIQLKIRYANWKQSSKQFLYTGGSDAIIHIYDAQTLKEKGTISGWNPFYRTDQQQEGHSSPIGDILPINTQQTLATACLGGNICLWDCNNNQLKKDLRGHDKGVYSLDWCNWSQMNHCLLSAGLDHEAFVWNTYVKDKIFLLRGHNHPLVGVKCLPQSPQIITADVSGMVKVWDVRNFLCIQTFNAPVEELSSFCLSYSTISGQNMKKRVICCGKKVHYFDYDEPKDQFLTDQKPCISLLYNPVLLCFITMHAECLKIWDAKDGKLISVYRGLSNGQLTCMILDGRKRKLFVGDSQGAIFTVNIKNGAKMKQFQKHQSAVTGLGYWCSDNSENSDERYVDLRRIISISLGTQVYIHDQDAPQDAKSSCRYIMKQHKLGCNSVSVKFGSQILCTGSDDGHAILTNLISYRHEVLPKADQTEIKHVLFLYPFECLIIINDNGRIIFYGCGDNKFKNKIMLQKQYKTQSMTNQLQQFPVTALCFDSFKNLLILGDQFGNITCWDLNEILKIVDSFKIEKQILSKRRQTRPLNKQNSQYLEESSLMLTQLQRFKETNFKVDMIKEYMKLKNVHNDGVTCLEMIQENQAFISSSFDCCCHIWNIATGEKLGSLLLGGDSKWNLKFNLQSRKKQANEEAVSLLERIGNRKMHLFSNVLNSQEDIQGFQLMKEGVLRGARDLLEKKNSGHPQQLIDILGQTNKLEQEFFELEDIDNTTQIQMERPKKNIRNIIK